MLYTTQLFSSREQKHRLLDTYSYTIWNAVKGFIELKIEMWYKNQVMYGWLKRSTPSSFAKLGKGKLFKSRLEGPRPTMKIKISLVLRVSRPEYDLYFHFFLQAVEYSLFLSGFVPSLLPSSLFLFPILSFLTLQRF